MTVPLGVLKAGAIRFEPPLPSALQEPIDRLGVGVPNTISLRFPQAFWPGGTYALRRLGAPNEHGHPWYDVSSVSGRPMLLTLAAGPWGRTVQGWDDEAVVASRSRCVLHGAEPT